MIINTYNNNISINIIIINKLILFIIIFIINIINNIININKKKWFERRFIFPLFRVKTSIKSFTQGCNFPC